MKTQPNSLEIIIDESLEIHPIHSLNSSYDKFLDSMKIDKNQLKHAELLADTKYYHKNYLHYVDLCYSYHRGVIINPTFLWNIFLNEIAVYINKNPEEFRSLFTTSDEKIEVIINQGGFIMNPKLMCESLRAFIPSNIDAFIPNFSTDSPNSSIALHATFLDAMSPYYSYGMFMCGIPKYKILGTAEDWFLFESCIGNLFEVFGEETQTELKNYFKRVDNIVSKILHIVLTGELDIEFMNKFFVDEPCGSGSQSEISGWIVDFYMDNSKRFLQNFPTLISSFEYKNYNESPAGDYTMYTGLFSSIETDDNYLIPDYGYLVCKK